jgi:hypothetical protein
MEHHVEKGNNLNFIYRLTGMPHSPQGLPPRKLHEETHHVDSLVEKGRETTFYYIYYNFQNLYILTGIPPSPSFSIEGSTVGSQAVASHPVGSRGGGGRVMDP